ncbi:phytanoyl-CoA dioxygenase [Penicillium macrosclerotiorum]|uniref:phytanoyl-CoA dioxygenase n=1 Tax=Penicillium macrosclerotiorum TaxID=303699 RepID=UPI002546F79F|nr:phytanoyl-CoA dioxygenase [Penicillium macrosclerotiorum]KAJ5682154.1 phytanoyl-CoA dioxygenase [Penicillium macrosclerotiorum]
MEGYSKESKQGVQCVSNDIDFKEIISILKRDGGIIVKGLIREEDIDKANEEVKTRLEQDQPWDGEFFPMETRRAPSLIARSPTYTRTQLMNPLFQAVCAHFLTTRSWFWWGDKRKESVSKPYVMSCTAIQVGPGAKAQPLHRDSFVNHAILPEIDEWNDERDENRETGIGMMVAGCKVTKENGGTQFIPGSHLWATDRESHPDVKDCIVAEMEKGDAFIMCASTYHGGGNNTTADQKRLVYSSFACRGYLRQEENQFLAVPRETVRKYDRSVQEFMGYSLSQPAAGQVEQLDPIYILYPELLMEIRPTDF